MAYASAAGLYEPCFANLIRHKGVNARASITRITLVAGLAGTVAFPTAHWLNSFLTWREALLVYAASLALITAPLTALAVSQLQSRFPVEQPVAKTSRTKLPFGRAFWLLASAFLIISFVHGMIITHLLPLLAERNVATSFAILVASSIGPMQVIGRLLIMATEKRASNLGTAAFCFGGMACGITALTLAGANQFLIATFVIVHGSAYGVTSIIRPVLTREVLGTSSFGQISGRIGGLVMLGAAMAPIGGSLIWQYVGYTTMLGLSAALMLLGMVLLRLVANQTKSV